MQLVCDAFARALLSAGKSIPTKIAIIAITISSSINEKCLMPRCETLQLASLDDCMLSPVPYSCFCQTLALFHGKCLNSFYCGLKGTDRTPRLYCEQLGTRKNIPLTTCFKMIVPVIFSALFFRSDLTLFIRDFPSSGQRRKSHKCQSFMYS